MPAPVSSATPSRSTRLLYGAGALASASAAIVALGLAAMANADWYETLLVASFDPPLWVSVPLWSLVDLALAAAFYRVLCRPDWMPDRRAAIRAYATTSLLAILWPAAFFALRSPIAGLVVMLGLMGGVVATGRLFGAVDRRAGLLAVACVLWIGFATLLSLSIAIRN